MQNTVTTIRSAFRRDFPLGETGDTQLLARRKLWLGLLGICLTIFAVALFSSVYGLANGSAFGRSLLGTATSGLLLVIGMASLAIVVLALSWLFLPKRRTDVSSSHPRLDTGN